MTRTIPRETVAKIVSDLAKGFRSPAEIARIHREPIDVVEGLRDAYGPSLGALAQAAEDLRRPAPLTVVRVVPDAVVASPPTAEHVPTGPAQSTSEPDEPAEPDPEPEPSPRKYNDGLTVDERRTCRAWAVAHRPTYCLSVRGLLPAQLVAEWIEAGRPIADPTIAPPAKPGNDIPAAVPEDVELTLDEWIGRARQHPELSTWVEAFDVAFGELAAAWLELAADARTLVEQRTRELTEAKQAAAALAPPLLRTPVSA